MRLAALAVVLATTAAHADGFYYSQGYGISSVRGDAAPLIGESIQLRLTAGWRFGAFTVGPWAAVDMAGERDGAYFRFVGGEPTMGDSDLKSYGVDGRYTQALHERVNAYVRTGPRYAAGLGALDGYSGFGVGAATGLQVTGRVRALGFLFAPLFFTNYGPKITASSFIDANVDWYHLDKAGMPSLSMPLVGVTVGIGAGSHF